MRKLLHSSLLIWIISSIFIVPLIAISQFAFTTGGGDYCDSSYMLSNGLGYSSMRDIEFSRANMFADVSSFLMLFVGFTLYILMLRGVGGVKSSQEKFILTLLTIAMSFGYIAIITILSGKGSQGC